MRVWEHSVLLFPSRSDVWLFLAVFSPEPLAGFNCLCFLATCTPARLPFCLSASLPFSAETGRRLPPRRSCRDALSETYTPRLQSHSLDKISRIPPWKQCSRRGEEGEFVSVSFSLTVCLFRVCDRGTKERRNCSYLDLRGRIKATEPELVY